MNVCGVHLEFYRLSTLDSFCYELEFKNYTKNNLEKVRFYVILNVKNLPFVVPSKRKHRRLLFLLVLTFKYFKKCKLQEARRDSEAFTSSNMP